MEFHPVEIPSCGPKSLWKFSACGDNRELSMLPSRSNQLVTAPLFFPSSPLFSTDYGLPEWTDGNLHWRFRCGRLCYERKKKKGEKKGERMQRTNKYLHPHRITGRRNIHPLPPYSSIFLDSVIKQTFTISLLFPTTRVVFRYLPPNRDITPSPPPFSY